MPCFGFCRNEAFPISEMFDKVQVSCLASCPLPLVPCFSSHPTRNISSHVSRQEPKTNIYQRQRMRNSSRQELTLEFETASASRKCPCSQYSNCGLPSRMHFPASLLGGGMMPHAPALPTKRGGREKGRPRGSHSLLLEYLPSRGIERWKFGL